MDAGNAAPIPPSSKSRHLRACLLCSIIQTSKQFQEDGCPNCEEILQLKGNENRIYSCTTTLFEGVIAVIDAETSWVAKWQRTSKYVNGMYAARVKGRLPEEIIESELESRNIKYRPRDQTDMD